MKEILPDWIAVIVLPITLFVCYLLWYIRSQRRKISKMKNDFIKQKKEDNLLVKQSYSSFSSQQGRGKTSFTPVT